MANAGKGFLGLLDMIDGGGMGQSGSKFEGGPLSGLLNALGIRPHGYMDRLAAVRPQARPAITGPQGRPYLPMVGMDEALVPGPIYSGRGNYGMPVQDMRMPAEIGNSGMGMGLPQYSGRGPVGMPINPLLNTPEGRQVLEYLRSVGAVGY